MARARSRRIALLVLLALIGGVLSAGVAAAVSGGGYQPSEQDCPLNADSNDAGQPTSWQPQSPVPGCHNFKLNVEDHHGGRYGQVWLDQTAQNQNVHSGGFKFNTNADGSGPGVSGTFDTNWQPFPPGSCGLFDLVVLPFDVWMCTLCNVPTSLLSNAIVNAFPAGAARQFLSYATLAAVICRLVPEGEHEAGDGVPPPPPPPHAARSIAVAAVVSTLRTIRPPRFRS